MPIPVDTAAPFALSTLYIPPIPVPKNTLFAVLGETITAETFAVALPSKFPQVGETAVVGFTMIAEGSETIALMVDWQFPASVTTTE